MAVPGTDAKDAVVASYEALNRHDIDAAMEALAEDAEWHESEVLPDTGVYRGRDAIRAFLTDFLDSWERFHQTVEEVRQEGWCPGGVRHGGPGGGCPDGSVPWS